MHVLATYWKAMELPAVQSYSACCTPAPSLACTQGGTGGPLVSAFARNPALCALVTRQYLQAGNKSASSNTVRHSPQVQNSWVIWCTQTTLQTMPTQQPADDLQHLNVRDSTCCQASGAPATVHFLDPAW